MNLKKNQEILLTIEDFTREGEGLGKYQGFPFFVKDTVIGDKIRVSITKLKKNYGYARLVQIITPSPDRVDPPCPVARQCGGCRIQQLSYHKQLEFKWNQVKNCLERIGGFSDIEARMEPILGMEDPWHYRNKAQYPIGKDKRGNPVAGFYAGRTHSIIPNTGCLIQAEVNQEILECILSWMKRYQITAYDEKSHSGLVRHVLTRVGFQSGQIMACLVINGTADQIKNLAELTDRLCRIPGMTSIIVNTNTHKTNKILGDHCLTVWGKDYIEDDIGDVRYRIGPLSFFQVNPVQTRVLYGKALEYAGLTGNETVWDLYCGIGTISLFLARKARQVYGVEIIPEAIEDARQNARINHIENVEFYTGKAEEVVPREYGRTGQRPDVIVVDPPRKGCDETLLKTMLDMAPDRIVYVSCDPGTLARDLKILCNPGGIAGAAPIQNGDYGSTGGKGYRIEKVAVVDQFGHSCHVETVVLLTRQNT